MTTPRGVRKLASGRYQARYTGPNGVRYPLGTFRTRTDAQKALLRIQMQISSGEWIDKRLSSDGGLNQESPLSDWLEDWVTTRSRAGRPLQSSTTNEYRRLMRSALAQFDKPICQIAESEVRRWWSDYRGRAPRAANASYKLMKSLLNEAVRRGVISRNPCDIPGAASYSPREKPALPSPEMVRELLEAVEFPWRAFFAIAAFGGLRRGEIAELRRSDIKREGSDSVLISVKRSAKWVSNSVVQVGYPKWDSERVVPLGPHASALVIDHLKVMAEDDTALLFSRNNDGRTHLAASNIRAAVTRNFHRIGYQGTFHSLRDFALTSFAQAGATIAEIMQRGGHRDFRAAMVYQQNTGRERELARRVEFLFSQPNHKRKDEK